ncbi:hypothetical protein I316_04961 [Kwoniella heveanensis BCC8398]|uniref:Uncharacterized protein n=1 Tax=Kwoniella heveanensis BCC8398 TaxID=1296120 RepID=A0A1B9GQ75_9TREE|nr:hypothetical protein I316_04961 [Kwoniella heveanensis BCC8398]
MRIHEILETCVEYIAFDGVVGSDPTRLIQYLVKLDPTLDYDYFSHLWTLLCAHPSIQVLLTTEPILLPGGTTEIGTAPLPEGWQFPQHVSRGDVDLTTLYKEGVRGRQLAFLLAGQEFRTDREAIQDKREAQKKKAQKTKQATLKKKKADESDVGEGNEIKVEPGGAGLLRVLKVDDSQEGDSSIPVLRTDYRRLSEKWGARLRIRCADDEIYYRLTGSHQKINKITSTVFHVLQLAAMSREKGITAIDLGPLVGASQGSMHYFMKVLVNLGLCAKVPAVLHASITNLLVFHRFLEQNANYRAIIGKTVSEPNPDEDATPGVAPDGEGNADEDQAIDPDVDDMKTIEEWGFNFSPLSESELMAGHVVKQRLLKMLDHPRLKSHLLRTVQLLPPLGWQGPVVTRHRRAVNRQIETLVYEGLVERLSVGEKAISCIRLVKYNPDYTAETPTEPVGTNEDKLDVETEHDLKLISAQPPYTPIGGIPLTVSFEYLILELIVNSGLEGMNIIALWAASSFIFKRSIDFAILRADNAWIPDHLWSFAISSVMETIGKERRLRLFSTAAYQQILFASGQELQGFASVPQPHSAGQWSDMSYRDFYTSADDFYRFLDTGTFENRRAKGRPKSSTKALMSASTKKSSSKKSKDSESTPAPSEADIELSEEPGSSKGNKRDFKYDTSVQTRGRPRKYVHVVEENGTVNRRIIGTVFSRPDLPPILIYMKDLNLLVEPPVGYNGVGVPPPVTEEAIQQGKPPAFYYQFPTRDPAAHSGQETAKMRAKRNKREQEAAAAESLVVDAVGNKGKRKDGKKRHKESAGSSGGEGTPTTARKSKRQRKEVKYTENIDMAGLEEDEGNVEMVQNPTPVPVPDPAPGAVPAPEHVSELLDSAASSRPSNGAPASEPQSEAAQPTEPSPKTGRNAKNDAEKVHAPTAPKRSRGTKGKAAEVPGITTPLIGPAGTSLTVQVVTPPKDSCDVLPSAISSVTSSDISHLLSAVPSGADIAHIPMEASIDSVLTELAHSGLRPRSRQSSVSPISNSEVTKGKGKKRKSTVAEISVKPTKVKKGKGKGKAKDRSPSPPGTPIFSFPGGPVEASPFHLAEDIVAIADSEEKAPDGVKERPEVSVSVGVGTATEVPGAQRPVNTSALEPTHMPASSPMIVPSVEAPVSSTYDSEFANTVGALPFVPPQTSATTSANPTGLSYPPAPQPESHAALTSPSASLPSASQTSPPAGTKRATSLPQTPLRQMTPVSDSSPMYQSSTPLRELAHLKERKSRLSVSNSNLNNGRVDLGNIRRANEIAQVLSDNGGALMDTKLLHEHRAWVYKYAGTDHPHAPATPYGMDRQIVRKTVNSLLNEGRIKETIVTVPTPTGRWVRTSVYYLSDLAQERLQAYIRQMSTTVAQAMTPVNRKVHGATRLPDTPLSDMKVTSRSIKTVPPHTITPTESGRHGEVRSFSERRMALLKEHKVVSQLYGWKAGRCLRTQTMYKAIIRAFNSPGCTSVVSTSPRIFAVPLLVEEITAGEWFSCVLTLHYNEEVDEWLKDPANRAMKVKDVPKRYHPRGGFGGSGTTKKMSTLLNLLITLKLISPVDPATSSEEAAFYTEAPRREGYKVQPDTTWSTYYLIHDYAPIYHIASDPPPLLGFLPTHNEEEVHKVWDTIQEASLQPRVDLLGRIGAPIKPGLPLTGNVGGILEMNPDQRRLFHLRSKWRDEMHLVPVQRAALDQTVDYNTGERTITTKEEIDNFAYENALPPSYVESELQRRSDAARHRSARSAERLQVTARRNRERQERVQLSIREKLLERQEAARKAWEEKVQAAAERKALSYDHALLEFISIQTLGSATTQRVEASDAVLDNWVDLWSRTKHLTQAERARVIEEHTRDRIQQQRRKQDLASKLKWVKTRNRVSKKPRQPKIGPHTRVKRKWTEEDDEDILDAEAIIRARSRLSGYRGRTAMNQLGLGVQVQTFLTRLRKITAEPGRLAYLEKLEQAYYDLWQEHRGTEKLPDENRDSPKDFDLKKHTQFLRANVDKRSLRRLATYIPAEQQEPAPDLPPSMYKILKDHRWTYVKTEDHSLDAAADSNAADDLRVNSVTAISLSDEAKLSYEPESSRKDMAILQAALKIIIGTPTQIYSPAHGSRLLSTWDSKTYDVAIEDMVNKQIFIKHKSPASTAGRFYVFASQWEKLGENLLPESLAASASNLGTKLDADEGIHWPLIGRSGELAALMGMVSNSEVNDDAYEFEFSVKRAVSSASRPNTTASLPDLKKCKPLRSWNSALDQTQEIQRTTRRVIEAVMASGPEGITKPELLDAIGCSYSLLSSSLADLARAQPQKVFWAGYDTARLILKDHWTAWTIMTIPKGGSQEYPTNPRRWCDVFGDFMIGDWNKAINAVRSLVVVRPGISLHEIRKKLELILDRLELVDILEYLVTSGRLRYTWSSKDDERSQVLPPVEAIDVDEEDIFGWFVCNEQLWRK